MSVKDYVPVSQFYAGKSVLITGAAGYLGKVLLEKLLYSCPDVDRVYVLLRDKKNVSAEQRLQTITELPVFSRLQKKRPQDLNKITVMKGDICGIDLNLSPMDVDTVIEKVSVVIHSAATVRFDEPLKVALTTNVEGTRNLLNLCHRMKNVPVFVHISTAYCNLDRAVLEEIVYLPPVSIDEAYKFVEDDPDEIKTAKFLNGIPNTYIFTKALAEHLVSETHGNIPAVIVRPSIVTASKDEPVKGWVDNWSGPTGLLTVVGKGVCRVLYSTEDNIMDLIPVDLVCNLTLVAAARAKRESKVVVYNSCSGSINPITTKQAVEVYCQECTKQRFNVLPYPNFLLYTDKHWLGNTINMIMLLCAHVTDLPIRLIYSAKDMPRLTELVKNAVMLQNITEFISSKSWLMKTDRARELYHSLSPADAKLFPCLADVIDWKEYMADYFHGIKKYLIEKNKSKL